ncbi:MAG: GNAT family N-acetyltransferase [Anaerolineae bacterium]|nr:GNAT family N-acetyltransferase [Anaerolineae bacterium]
MTNYQISQEDNASSAEKEIINRGLGAYNATHFGYEDGRPFNLFIRNQNGDIIGGLLGYTYWGFLAIDTFWLDESLRGQGLGEKMLAMAEQEAVQRGCTTVHLDTFEFQAPRFYEKYGYKQWGELDGFAGRFKRIYYQKRLKHED